MEYRPLNSEALSRGPSKAWLTCDADVGVITAEWVARRHTEWPNFNTWHTCRNFDGIVEWSKEHNAPYDGHPLRRPDNIAGLEIPP